MAYSDDGGVFGVDMSGWVEQHRSRDVYEVVREPVQNALDTGSDLYVRIDYGDQSVTVEDYGDGVEDLPKSMTCFRVISSMIRRSVVGSVMVSRSSSERATRR